MCSTAPETPPYSKREFGGPQAFLVTQKQFFFDAEYTAAGEQWSLILSGQVNLWVLGYVDYRDQFGRRHRAGYARVFVPDAKERENNLAFLTTPGYNYDRELTAP